MTKRILIIDDEKDMRVYLGTLFRKAGYETETASDGDEGLKLASSFEPDLITLDILMPKQSGIKMYRELKSDDTLKGIPVIILSGVSKRTFLRSQEALTEFGGNKIPEPEAYIEKPVEPEDLAELLKELTA